MMKALLKIKLLGIYKKTLQSNKTKQSKLKTAAMILLLGYVAVVCVGMFYLLFETIIEPFHAMYLDWLYFAFMAIMIIMLCFFGSVFLTEHELYEAKDNDLLLSLPISHRSILISRLCSILILDYVFELLIAIPAGIVYFRFYGFYLIAFFSFLIIIMTLPFMVMTITMIMAWIVAMFMKKVKYKNIFVIVLWVLFFVLYFFGVSKIQDYIIYLVQNGNSIANAIEKGLFPIYHLALAISDHQLSSMVYYLLCTFIPFGIVLYLLSVNFAKLTGSKGKEVKRVYREKTLKVKSVFFALYMKELKQFLSNPMVILNGAVGVLMLIIACVAVIVYRQDLLMVISQFPFSTSDYVAAACLVSIALGSLNTLSASLISLEGQQLWIIKSLPLETKSILLSKLMLHLSMCIPGHIIFGLIVTLVLKFTLSDMLVIICVPVCLTVFVALTGLLFNLWKPRFDWINATVCVKQSMPVFLTMLVSMFAVVAVVYGYIRFLSDIMTISIYTCFIFVLFAVIDMILYSLLLRYGKAKWKNIY